MFPVYKTLQWLIKWLSWSISMHLSCSFPDGVSQNPMKLRWHCQLPSPGADQGQGDKLSPWRVEELSQVSGYYSAMRGSWELFCSVLWMFRPLRSCSFMWDYQRNGANSYRMKSEQMCTFVCVYVCVRESFSGKKTAFVPTNFQENVNIQITWGLL